MNWNTWLIVGCLVLGFSDVLMSLAQRLFAALPNIKWPAGTTTAGNVTAQQAFQSAENLADFKANSGSDPAYPLVMAALEKLTEKSA